MDRDGTRALLAAYAPNDAAEIRYRDSMLALLARPDAFSRAHFEPGHFTTSAFVMSPERERVLLIFHKKLGLWLQPGGHLEPGDSDCLSACRREVCEEVGLEHIELGAPGIFDIDVHEIPAWGTEPAHRHFDVRFWFVSPTDIVTETTEVAGARWVPFADVANASDASVARAVRKLAGYVARS